MYVCFISIVIPLGRGGTQALNSGCKVDQVDFTDMMSFPPSNLMMDISPNSGALSANTRIFSSGWNSSKDKNDLDISPAI